MRISWIEEGAVACGEIPISVENVQVLHERGIRAIVTLTEHPLTVQKALPQEVFTAMGMVLLHLPVVDQHPPTVEQATAARDFVHQMRDAGKPVYIHCHAGIGRTGTLIHALYMLGGMSFAEVRELIRQRRPASQFFMLSELQQAFLEQLALHHK